MFKEFREELWDEISDFFEDYYENIFRVKPKKIYKEKTTTVNGVLVKVRPAYLFAERLDNTLKVIFGVSICISAVTATFLGFTKLSDLLEVLINTLPGRLMMFVIGISYLLTSLWKLMHLGQKEKV